MLDDLVNVLTKQNIHHFVDIIVTKLPFIFVASVSSLEVPVRYNETFDFSLLLDP